MTQPTVDHGAFTVERTYPATPQRVFAAWASQPAKDAWFGTGDDFLERTDGYSLDFQVGGRERLDGVLPGGQHFTYDAIYRDIVEDRRLILVYDIAIDGRRTSVSLMTVELEAVAGGTRLVLTEQGAFLEGTDSNGQRREGATDMLDQLAAYLGAGVPA